MMTPENWIITTLGEIGTWSSGGTPSRKNSSYYGGDIPWVKTGDLNDSLIHNTPENITKEGLRNSSAKIFPPETLLIAMYGATIGKLGILSIEASTNQACGALLPGGETRHLIPFIFYYLLSERENIRAIAKGGAQPNISQTVLKSYPFPLPPLQEQSRITSKIESLQSRSTKARKALEAIPPLLEQFRQSILSSAFRGDLTDDWRAQNPDIEPAEKLLERIRKERRKRWEENELAKMKAKGKTPKDDKWKKKYKEPEPVDTSDLPELPEGWCWATIDEIAFVGTGATPNRSNTTYWNNGTIPWVTSGALNEKFVDEPTEYVTEKALKETNLTVYPPGTLLLAMYGEGKTRGKCAQLIISATTNQAIAAIAIEEGGQELAKLLKYFLVLNYEKTRMTATGGVQPNLNLSIVRKISFPLLPIKEQKVFNDKIESSLVKTESVSTISSQLLKQLSILDQSILSKAFRGELVLQDPNDEPASQLLERIKIEKASLEAGKKQKGKVGKGKTVIRKRKATAMAKKNERRPLVEVLQPHSSGLSPEELFQQAGFDEHLVDEFYIELKNEVVCGNIIEDRPDQERVLLRLNAA